MGSFANNVFSILLGWLQGLISMIWSAMTAKDGNSFLQVLGNNWIKIAVILCAAGLIADFAVYFFRWAPYKVWRTFWRHLKGERKETESVGNPGTAAEPVSAFSENREEAPEYVRRWRTPEPEEPLRRRIAEPAYRENEEPEEPRRRRTAEPAYRKNEEPDELLRWRTPEQEEEEPGVPVEITKAGYTVPADSPYRRPGDRNSRRRLRISLLGDSEEDDGVHYYSPRPMVDQKEAYHAPVYPEKWTGSREQDS